MSINMAEEIREGTLTPDESLEILLRKRSDLNAEITEAIDQDRFKDALKMLKEVEELDAVLDGEVTNSTLFRSADASAGLRDWAEAARYGETLRDKVKCDIAELKAKAEREPLAAAESINLQSLPQLLAIVERRLPLFQDYGQRLSSIRELLTDPESSENDLHKKCR